MKEGYKKSVHKSILRPGKVGTTTTKHKRLVLNIANI